MKAVERARKEAKTYAGKAAAAAARAEQLAAAELQSAIKAIEETNIKQAAERVQTEAQQLAAQASAAAAKAGQQVADEVQAALTQVRRKRFFTRAKADTQALAVDLGDSLKEATDEVQTKLKRKGAKAEAAVAELSTPKKGWGWWRLFALVAFVGLGIVIYRAVKQYREDSVFELAPAGTGATSLPGGEKRGISPDLLEILADPGDKGPVELITDADGKEWLVNRRNGYRYPVEDGIPIMLLEEGEKHKDESLITR
jgi:uncharacterized protein YbaR (Trm112 family)